MLASTKIEYRNFEGERNPFIGVYYLFLGCRGFGLCSEFRVDMEKCIYFGTGVIIPRRSYEFSSESGLMDQMQERQIQGIKTEPVDGVSFHDLSVLIAGIHLNEFLRRHFWLRKSLRVENAG